jgi:hypothetical protein
MAVLTRRRGRSEQHLVDAAAPELKRRPAFPAREAEARRPVRSAARRHDYVEMKRALAYMETSGRRTRQKKKRGVLTDTVRTPLRRTGFALSEKARLVSSLPRLQAYCFFKYNPFVLCVTSTPFTFVEKL